MQKKKPFGRRVLDVLVDYGYKLLVCNYNGFHILIVIKSFRFNFAWKKDSFRLVPERVF